MEEKCHRLEGIKIYVSCIVFCMSLMVTRPVTLRCSNGITLPSTTFRVGRPTKSRWEGRVGQRMWDKIFHLYHIGNRTECVTSVKESVNLTRDIVTVGRDRLDPHPGPTMLSYERRRTKTL